MSQTKLRLPLGRLSVRSSVLRFVRLQLFCAAFILVLMQITARAQAVAPELIGEIGSTRAVALESVTWKREPFAPVQVIRFSNDNRTRVMLFAKNLDLLPGEDASAVTAEAEDAARTRYPLTVEYVGKVAGYNWLTSVIVRLNDNLGDVGDVLVGITYHGVASNRVRVGVGHIGGGPPDDGPIPDLGAGASLHGRLPFPPGNDWDKDICQMPVDP